VIGSLVLLSVRLAGRVMVLAIEKKVGSKLISAGLVSELALDTAANRLPAPVGFAFSTVHVVGVTRSSSRSIWSR
jgi:hypothetical protein